MFFCGLSKQPKIYLCLISKMMFLFAMLKQSHYSCKVYKICFPDFIFQVFEFSKFFPRFTLKNHTFFYFICWDVPSPQQCLNHLRSGCCPLIKLHTQQETLVFSQQCFCTVQCRLNVMAVHLKNKYPMIESNHLDIILPGKLHLQKLGRLFVKAFSNVHSNCA